MKPLVSVIIPTRDSGKTLETCLKSISEQTWPNVEVLIVDSHSSDSTAEIADRFGAKVFETRAGRSRARNIGAENAMGNLILFLDADMELSHEVVECCVEKVRDHYDAVIIPEVSVGEGFWARCKALEKTCYIGDDTIEAARFFRKTVFESIGGYDLRLEAGEDWDLSQKIIETGHRVGRIEAFIVHHEGELRLLQTVMKKHNYGKTVDNYRKKRPETAKQQLRLPRPAYIRNWKKLAKDPAHALGMLFMKTCEFVAGWIGSLE